MWQPSCSCCVKSVPIPSSDVGIAFLRASVLSACRRCAQIRLLTRSSDSVHRLFSRRRLSLRRAHPPAQALRGCERRALSARLVRGLMVAIAAFGLSVRSLCSFFCSLSCQSLQCTDKASPSLILQGRIPYFVLWLSELDRRTMASQRRIDPEHPSRLDFAVPLGRLAEVAAGWTSAWTCRSMRPYASDASVCRALLWHTWASDRINCFLQTYKGADPRPPKRLRLPVYKWLVPKYHTLKEAKDTQNLLPVDAADQVVRQRRASA